LEFASFGSVSWPNAVPHTVSNNAPAMTHMQKITATDLVLEVCISNVCLWVASEWGAGPSILCWYWRRCGPNVSTHSGLTQEYANYLHENRIYCAFQSRMRVAGRGIYGTKHPIAKPSGSSGGSTEHP